MNEKIYSNKSGGYTIRGGVLSKLSFAYLYSGILIFLFGWTKLYIALGVSAVIIASLVLFYKRTESMPIEENFCISGWGVGLAFAWFAAVIYFSGIGGFTLQSGDWNKHNAILNDLVLRDWPVYYVNGDEHSMLVYYIGQYLVPALVGKVFKSFDVASVINALWAYLGLLLVYFNLIRVIKAKTIKMQIITMVLLTFFSVPLWLGQLILAQVYPYINNVGNVHWFIWDSGMLLQYSSNFVLLRWVHPQTITTWMMFLLFLSHKNEIENYVIILLPGVLYATMPFAGMLPFAFAYAAYVLFRDKDVRTWSQKILSKSNLALTASLGTVLLFYFKGNVLSQKPADIGLSMIDYNGHGWVYAIFVGVLVLIYAAILWKENKRNILYYTAVSVLSILPLFTMGVFNDFVMRVSIPALFVLMVLILEYINKCKSVSLGSILLAVCLLIGFYYPVEELKGQIKPSTTVQGENVLSYGTMERFANRSNTEVRMDERFNYYTYDIQDDMFYRYLARKQ